jgi:sugar phosphate isomerase/epimerase
MEANIYPEGYEQLPSGRLGSVQVKAGTITGPRQLPWQDMMERMRRDGYRGLFVMETGGMGSSQVTKAYDAMEELVRLQR